jgi:hypothetical protein
MIRHSAAREANRASHALDAVEPTEVLSQHRLVSRLRIPPNAVAAMFHRGLRYRTVKQTKFVSGRDVLAYLEAGKVHAPAGDRLCEAA